MLSDLKHSRAIYHSGGSKYIAILRTFLNRKVKSYITTKKNKRKEYTKIVEGKE